MPIPIVIQEVQLPNDFSVKMSNDQGSATFEFNAPVPLPYDDLSLEYYRAAVDGARFDPSFKSTDVANLTYEVMKAVLSGFTGRNGFYNEVKFDASALYGFDVRANGDFWLTHAEENRHKARLHFKVHSAEKFLPVIKTEGIERPTIDKGTITGKIYLGIRVPHPEGEGYVYSAEVGCAILTALALNQPLTLQRNALIRYDYSFGDSGVYIQVENPIIERMQAALLEEKILAEYLTGSLEPLKEAAKLLAEARIIDNNHKQEILAAQQLLFDRVQGAKQRIDQEIPLPKSIDDTIARIDCNINAKLQEATQKVAHLSAGLPRGFLNYATAESNQR